jgi:hypothetical protein
LLAIPLKIHYTIPMKTSSASKKLTLNSIEYKLAEFLLNPPINLFKLSMWTLAISLVLFVIAGIFGQMLLAVLLSAIAGFAVFIAITQTKLFVKFNNYLKVHLPARADRWIVVVMVVVGITALITSVFVS